MKGRSPTVREKEHMDTVAQGGCYCCKQMGIENTHVSIHHTKGRTSKQAHYHVIALCSEHHDYFQPEGLHNNKARWEAKWGKQKDIVAEINQYMDESAFEQQCNSFEGYDEN